MLSLLAAPVFCQKSNFRPPKDGENIVPNGGFEVWAEAPIGWFYKGSHFGQVMKYWYSATTSSPDAYGPKVKVPADWQEKGFGEQKPRSGRSMTGITVFGCENGKPHCREYLQVQLAEPLVPGQFYEVEFWATHLARSLQIDQIGVLFSLEAIERKTDELLIFEPQVKTDQILVGTGGKWKRVRKTFRATDESEFLTLGNFADDAHTRSTAYRSDCFNYAYYYIDDVSVRKIPPFLPPPVKQDDLTLIPLTKGDTVQLRNIYFEFDRAELMPRSFVELNKLLKIMRGQPRLSVEIVGHTDSQGDDGYNLDLSKRRARAVVDFLVENRIDRRRLRTRGEGERQPIAENKSDLGRSLNRRVEFVVLEN